jgi:hypothetical protein
MPTACHDPLVTARVGPLDRQVVELAQRIGKSAALVAFVVDPAHLSPELQGILRAVYKCSSWVKEVSDASDDDSSMKSFRMKKFDGNEDVTHEAIMWGLLLLFIVLPVAWFFYVGLLG